jgi:hypothetical protein
MGVLILAGWAVVGLLVAGLERNRGDADPAFVTQLCVVGAIAGGFAGQITRWYVFGEPLGFVFAAAGAELLLRSYRRRTSLSATLPAPVPPPALAPLSTTPAVAAPSFNPSAWPLVLRGAEALAWGVASALLFAVTAVVANTAAERIYRLNEPHVMSLLIYVPVGLVIGFIIGVGSCLRQPRRTIRQMFVFLAIAAFVWGAVIMALGKWDASYEHGRL